MKIGRSTLVVLQSLVILTIPREAWSNEANQTSSTQRAAQDSIYSLEIDWKTVGSKIALPDSVKDGESVVVRVKNFNFFKYELKETVSEREIESYTWLSSLWSEILTIGGGMVGVAGDQKPPLTEALLAWLAKLTEVDGVISASLKEYDGLASGLTSDEANWTSDENSGLLTIGNALKAASELNALRQDALRNLGEAESFSEIEWYNRISQVDAKVDHRLAAYVSAARLTTSGKSVVCAPRKAGTLVALTLEASGRAGESGDKVVVVEYLVTTKWPLVYQLGYAYSSLKEVDFEKVRTAAGRDMFTAVQTDEFQGLVAFLGYEFRTSRRDLTVLVNLGTSASNPGEDVLLGLGVRFKKRFVVQAGVMSGLTEEGVDPVLEDLADNLGVRQLYSTIARSRSVEAYVGVSFVIGR